MSGQHKGTHRFAPPRQNDETHTPGRTNSKPRASESAKNYFGLYFSFQILYANVSKVSVPISQTLVFWRKKKGGRRPVSALRVHHGVVLPG